MVGGRLGVAGGNRGMFALGAGGPGGLVENHGLTEEMSRCRAEDSSFLCCATEIQLLTVGTLP